MFLEGKKRTAGRPEHMRGALHSRLKPVHVPVALARITVANPSRAEEAGSSRRFDLQSFMFPGHPDASKHLFVGNRENT
jgi:hypothetical protein